MRPHGTDGRPQRWDDCDPDIRAYVEQVVAAFRQALGGGLVGVYLHGSLAMGCYYRPKSDLDLLAVVGERLDPTTRRELALMTADLSAARPTLGDLELSVLWQGHTRHFTHPSPYELHYSAAWRERIQRGEVDYAADGRDPDLAAHCTVVRARGVALVGPPIAEIFGPVPWDDYLDAVRDDYRWIVEDDHILETPFYGVLNCCRALALLTESEGTVRNKEEGGLWGLAHLPDEHRPVIEQALWCYRSPDRIDEAHRLTGGLNWDAEALRRFRDHTVQVVK